MSTINKTSIRIPSQLPEFIRDDLNYETFVAFVEAYYEWLELSNTSNSAISTANTTNQGVTYAAQNLLNYSDIDSTLDGFMRYYINDFLPNFPEDALSDKDKVVKLARQLYDSKGTPSSYKLLFRLLYNSDAEMLYTRDLVFRASSGEWYIPKYLKIRSNNSQWISPSILKNLKIFGLTSKSFAVIENVVTTNKAYKYNVYISQIERLFQSGEYIKIVDSSNQEIFFKDGQIVPAGTPGSDTLTAHVVGSISTININPKYRGLKYRVNDPVVVYGGVDELLGVRAKAHVSETTKGSIQRLNIVDGGYGYRPDPNTKITFTGGGGGSGAIAHVQTVNTAAQVANVTFVGSDIIALKSHLRMDAQAYNFSANLSANSSCALANAFSLQSFSTYPIDSVIVDNGGGGYSSVPSATADSLYFDELPSQEIWIKNGVIYTTNVSGSTPVSSNTHSLASIGILAPIHITSSGAGYQANDKIVFSGGSGVGAFANVTSVDGSGKIQEVSYVSNYIDTEKYPLGGMGYTNEHLPSLTILSSNVNATGANVVVPGILGTGASFSLQTDRIGSITRIEITEGGEDYVRTPNVSFRVQDLVVTNITGDLGAILPQTPLFQGEDVDISGSEIDYFDWVGYIDSITPLVSTSSPTTDIYKIRVYNYTGNLDLNKPLYADIENQPYPSMYLSTAFDGALTDETAYHNGIKSYGNGTAKGSAKFLEGLVYGAGRYLSTVGQPSSYSVLQSEIHNDYTYILSVEKPIAQYRNILKNLLHPSGTRVIGRDILKNNKNFSMGGFPGLGVIHPLQYWLDYPVGDSGATITLQTTGELMNTNIKVVTSGNGYNSLTTTVQVSSPNLPNGVQATAVANVANGRIVGVTFTNPGSGYTTPTITILDSTTRSGNANAYVTVYPKMYSNSVVVQTQAGSDMFNQISINDYLYIDYGPKSNLSSRIHSLDGANSIITLDDDIWLTYPNVAYAYSNLTSNKIVISDISTKNTPNYDIINNRNYSNTDNHIEDIVFAGDYITIAGNTYIVKSIDYSTNEISIVNESGILVTESIDTVTTEDSANNLLLGSFVFNAGTKTNPVPFTINRTINTPRIFIRKTE